MADMEAVENSSERAAYIASFASAMKAVEEQQNLEHREGKAYRELNREGLWDAETIAMTYAAIVGGFSSLSARLRKYILMLGALAKKEFEKLYKNGKENEKDCVEAPSE